MSHPPSCGPRAAAWLVLLVTLLCVVRVCRQDPYLLSADHLYYQGFSGPERPFPAAALDRDYVGRVHPLFVLTLTVLQRLGGPGKLPLTVMVYAGHLASVLLLLALLRKLGAGPRAALTAACLLAVFPGANNLFADPLHYARTWNLALALGALWSLAAGRAWIYLALYAATLLNFEDALLLPFAALAVRRAGGRLPLGLSFGLLGLFVLRTVGGADLGPPPSLGTSLLLAARVVPEVAHAVAVPRPELVPWRALRLLLGGAFVLLLLRARRDGGETGSMPIRPLLVLALCFTVPYLARPVAGPWPSRYLYFPAAPLLALLAIPLSRLRLRPRALALAWAAAVGLTTTELASDVIAERHQYPFTRRSAGRAIELIADRLRLDARPAEIELDAAACRALTLAHVPGGVECDNGLARSPRRDTLDP